MPCPILVGASLTVTGNRAVNKIGVDGLEGFITNPKPVHNAGSKLFNHHVVLCHQLLDQVGTALLLQIQPKGSLTPIEEGVGCTDAIFQRRHHSGQVQAARGLHPQYIRAHIRQQHGSVGAWQQCTEIQNLQVAQWAGHANLLLYFWTTLMLPCFPRGANCRFHHSN